jgi:hypothetical protein
MADSHRLVHSAFSPGEHVHERLASPEERRHLAWVRARVLFGMALFSVAIMVQWQLSDVSLYLYGRPVAVVDGRPASQPGETVELWCRGLFADTRAGTSAANTQLPDTYCEGRLVAFVPWDVNLGEAPRTAHLILFGGLAAGLIAAAGFMVARRRRTIGLDLIHQPRFANLLALSGSAALVLVLAGQIVRSSTPDMLRSLVLLSTVLLGVAALAAGPIVAVVVLVRWTRHRP